MQTQPTSYTHQYIDAEKHQRFLQQSEVWYCIYDHAIHQVICNSHRDEVIGLSIFPTPDLYSKTLSEIQALIRSFALSGDDFQQVHVVFTAPRYTFVPEPLFDAGKAAEYLNLLFPKRKWESAYFERHTSLGLVNVYGVNDLFYNALRLALPGVVFHHAGGLLADLFAQQAAKEKEESLYGYFQDQGMELFHYKEGKLAYHNYFPFEADTDIVYFILSVAETLRFTGDQWQLVVAGNINMEDSLVALMKKYIPEVIAMKRPATLNCPVSFREFQEQQHLIELAGLLCAS